MHDIQKDLNRPERLAMMQRAVDAAARTPWVIFPEEPAPPRVEDVNPTLADLLRQVANDAHPIVKRLVFSSSGLYITRKPTLVIPTPGRNAPCHCGSGKKYKKCCGA